MFQASKDPLFSIDHVRKVRVLRTHSDLPPPALSPGKQRQSQTQPRTRDPDTQSSPDKENESSKKLLHPPPPVVLAKRIYSSTDGCEFGLEPTKRVKLLPSPTTPTYVTPMWLPDGKENITPVPAAKIRVGRYENRAHWSPDRILHSANTSIGRALRGGNSTPNRKERTSSLSKVEFPKKSSTNLNKPTTTKTITPKSNNRPPKPPLIDTPYTLQGEIANLAPLALQLRASDVTLNPTTLPHLLTRSSIPATRTLRLYGTELLAALRTGNHDQLNAYLGRQSIAVAAERVSYLASTGVLRLVDGDDVVVRNGIDAVLEKVLFVRRLCRCEEPRRWGMRVCKGSGCAVGRFHGECLSDGERGRCGAGMGFLCDDCFEKKGSEKLVVGLGREVGNSGRIEKTKTRALEVWDDEYDL